MPGALSCVGEGGKDALVDELHVTAVGLPGGRAVVFPLKDCFCFYLDVFTENVPPPISTPNLLSPVLGQENKLNHHPPNAFDWSVELCAQKSISQNGPGKQQYRGVQVPL